MAEIRFYPEAWYKVEYSEINEAVIGFTCYKITELNADKIEDSKIEDNPSIVGQIKWDDCMDFKQEDHYCFPVRDSGQFSLLINEIYKFKIEKLGHG